AELAAELDRLERGQRQLQHEIQRADRAEAVALDGPIIEVDDLADLVARAALTAAGYHQHTRRVTTTSAARTVPTPATCRRCGPSPWCGSWPCPCSSSTSPGNSRSTS